LALRRDNDMEGMKQKARVLTGREGPGQVTGIEMVQELSFVALGRNEVLELTRVSSPYLLDELESRGYEIDGRAVRRPGIRETVEGLVELMEGEGVALGQLMEMILRVALDKSNGIQKDAARMIGVSPRMMCYHVKNLKRGVQTLPEIRRTA